MHPFGLIYIFQSRRNQWKSAEEIKRIQDRKLKNLVQHAYNNVPYYENLFRSVSLKPSDIRGIEDLAKIPLSSKRTYAGKPRKEFLSRSADPARFRESRSSGSTGVPLSIFHRRKDLTITNFGFLRMLRAHGYKPWYKKVEFTGSRNVPKYRSWYEYLGFLRRKVLSDATDPSQWIQELRTWRPEVIMGYVMMLRQLAKTMGEQGIDWIKPRLVFSTSATLDQTTRSALMSAFETKVIDYYASEEGRCIAWECDSCSGYHINADLLILEVVNEDGEPVPQGTEGEITITNLHSYAMPFIRYRQGDVGALSEKQPVCGRGLPLLKHIQGRTDDFILSLDGRRISPRLFYYALWTVPGVAEFRLIQKDLHHIRVEIFPSKEYDEASTQLLLENIRQLIGNEVEIDLSLVRSIPRGPSEKYRTFTCMIKDEHRHRAE
jgi:phenylacetate-CoA ligase